MDQVSCKKCHYIVSKEWYFCPNCGKKLRRPPLSTSFFTQLSLYLVCVLFPPFGIVPGVRYIFQKKTQAIIVGIVCIALTLVATAGTLIVAQKLYIRLQQQIDSQMQYYNELGL